ncbi:HsdM family class I SAM-dependent methyltransferase [Diplocloster agilis]|uniref:site-specific DNA-methyltransferase (adenine-specific) n=1 Tax=Diplocloster agilis TaxID=2850323 RepID=A0A949NJ37_9FIRM|nr:N-6 DNA methylase [Diplocloster agilis]MBU9739470.1 N-6 DNA methylase [Diplocloster agilis]
MEYMSAHEAAEKWGITKRRVQILCASNRIDDAVRVGNMWIIPTDAEKPADGRIKAEKVKDDKIFKNPIRTARNRIKAITTAGMKKMSLHGLDHDDAKLSFVMLFASELMQFYITKAERNDYNSSVNAALERITRHNLIEYEGNEVIRANIREFLKDNPFCCDDALSWAYQYANKVDPGASYSNTQFFTEKYMITTLVDSIDLVSRKKVLDPACGGGNFLLYCLDVLAEKYSLDDKKSNMLYLQNELSKLNGYEIDKTLALVASINLRLKCLAILSEHGHTIDVEDFESFLPNIYYPERDTVPGALDITNIDFEVLKVGELRSYNSNMVFFGVDAVVTNPPFQTIKGMPESLKKYLKDAYPKSKCDMCNAFIELSYKLLEDEGIAGLVTQNSWMYLDSFEELRQTLLSDCSIDQVWELGSDAFYDLSGEKSNVALLLYRKTKPKNGSAVRLISLKTMELTAKESLLSYKKDDINFEKTILQSDIFNNEGSRFDMISSRGLRTLLVSSEKYEEYAIPMQGTSTGNAKELIDFYWNHINDKDWILVSKGGGYSRWCGLNHYCVKWGKDGQYIKATKGSAIRNASYFDQTQMVFSDTGTSGLNVRKLLPGQIFVASGPGIRIKEGKTNAHLAFLNSRIAAYYIRLLSPKLTIAAGYIAKLPTCLNIMQSTELDEYGKRCLEAKRHRLAKRACNIEFMPLHHSKDYTYQEMAFRWFMEDINDEWTQLQLEAHIDAYIEKELLLSVEDLEAINNSIGSKKVFLQANDEAVDLQELESILKKSIDSNCNTVRTKSEKKALGCDGLLEYISQKLNISCENIYKVFTDQAFYPSIMKERYENLYLHSVVVSALGYPYTPVSMNMDELTKIIGIDNKEQVEFVQNWIIEQFNDVHFEALMKSPVFEFIPSQNRIVYRKEGKDE